MRSALKKTLLLVTGLLVNGCASSNPLRCSELTAPVLGRPTASAVIGDSGDAALDWQVFGLAQTGQLQTANNDKSAGQEILERCEAAFDRRPFLRFKL